MSEIRFIDTTLRDGQQSLWALGMRTGDMLGAAEQMDRIGFESMEFFVSIMIKKYVRELKENPWVWIREGVKKFRHTRLRNHGGLHGSGAMEKLPQAAMKLLAERVVSYGITLTRTSNCWNDFEEMREELRDLRSVVRLCLRCLRRLLRRCHPVLPGRDVGLRRSFCSAPGAGARVLRADRAC